MVVKEVILRFSSELILPLSHSCFQLKITYCSRKQSTLKFHKVVVIGIDDGKWKTYYSHKQYTLKFHKSVFGIYDGKWKIFSCKISDDFYLFLVLDK